MPGVTDHMMPGVSMRTVLSHLRLGQISVKDAKNVLLHVGVVDILNIINSRSGSHLRNTPVHVILCRFIDFILEVRKRNTEATIFISGVLPVQRQHSLTKHYIMGVNNGLKLIVAKFPKCVYIDSPGLFTKNFDPEPRFFEDGLHLTTVAKSILGGRFRQAIHISQVEHFYNSTFIYV
jgi:hypothetical protein